MKLKADNGRQYSLGMMMAVYLSGIFMGAIDTGIVTPARTVIQNNLGVDEKTGIWMITIYTLAYAASIPVMGKLADRLGRKYVYITSISLFGLGSLFCGLSQDFGSFGLLLAARAVQAVGGGGIMPVATAEFGTTFPKEKRGMALGLVGAVYGIANIIGSSVGSAVLDIFGTNNWQYLFYINVPITLFVVIAGIVSLPNNKGDSVKKIDKFGILLVVMMVLSLLYGLRNIDFFNFGQSLLSTSVYPFLIAFLVLLPLFALSQKKAEDPVMNLSYFKSPRIAITLVLSFIVGVVMMGMVFVPQFSENALKIASGSGGYFVMILGVFAGGSSPVSGRLIDKYGTKKIMSLGFVIAILGSLFLIFVAAGSPSWVTVVVSLMLIGTGLGFVMGPPLNYMMLDDTPQNESNSALATLSLVRSIGTAIAPAIMVGFLAHAGASLQGDLMKLLPSEITVPELPYAQELTEKFNALKANPSMKDKLAGIEFPDLATMKSIPVNMSGGGGTAVPADLLQLVQTADVTNITKRTEAFASGMFDLMAPKQVAAIQNGIQKGIDSLNQGISGMQTGLSRMQKPGAPESDQVKALKTAIADMQDTVSKMTALKDAIPGAFETAKQDYAAKIEANGPQLEKTFQDTLNIGFRQVYWTAAIASLLALAILALYRKKPAD